VWTPTGHAATVLGAGDQRPRQPAGLLLRQVHRPPLQPLLRQVRRRRPDPGADLHECHLRQEPAVPGILPRPGVVRAGHPPGIPAGRRGGCRRTIQLGPRASGSGGRCCHLLLNCSFAWEIWYKVLLKLN
jgi:hypothetical protein